MQTNIYTHNTLFSSASAVAKQARLVVFSLVQQGSNNNQLQLATRATTTYRTQQLTTATTTVCIPDLLCNFTLTSNGQNQHRPLSTCRPPESQTLSCRIENRRENKGKAVDENGQQGVVRHWLKGYETSINNYKNNSRDGHKEFFCFCCFACLQKQLNFKSRRTRRRRRKSSRKALEKRKTKKYGQLCMKTSFHYLCPFYNFNDNDARIEMGIE